MARYTRVSRVEFPSIDPARQGMIDVAYVYHDERFATVMFQIPKEEDSQERVQEELQKAVEMAAGAGAQTIEIE